MWSTHFSHPKVASLQKGRQQKGAKSESKEGGIFRSFTVLQLEKK